MKPRKGQEAAFDSVGADNENGEISFDISDIWDPMGLKQYMEIFCEDLLRSS